MSYRNRVSIQFDVEFTSNHQLSDMRLKELTAALEAALSAGDDAAPADILLEAVREQLDEDEETDDWAGLSAPVAGSSTSLSAFPLTPAPRDPSWPKYGWIIDRDVFYEALDRDAAAWKSEVGRTGPRNGLPVPPGEGIQFELYDGDNELYYIGRIVGEFTGFEPLEDFGGPNDGCTAVKLNGEWL